MFMSGGSRGIGLAIAARAARDGAKIALIAKTAQPHPKLPGTIHTAAAEIEAAGGEALPIVGDIRDADTVTAAVEQTVERFGGIDLVVNNASAINLAPMRDLEVKRFDLMQDINARGTFVVTRAACRTCASPTTRTCSRSRRRCRRPALAGGPQRLHALQDGHDDDHARRRRRRGRGRHRRQLPLAAHDHRHGRRAEPARRRRGDGPLARPRDLRGRRLRDPEPRPALVHRKRLHRRRGLAEAGVTDLDQYSGTPDAELALDIFVDGWPSRSRL